jgi:hypothetical protein
MKLARPGALTALPVTLSSPPVTAANATWLGQGAAACTRVDALPRSV